MELSKICNPEVKAVGAKDDGPLRSELVRLECVPDSLVETCSVNPCPLPLLGPDVVIPRSHHIQVPHISQLYDWDCGLACALMVLRALRIDGCDLKSLAEQCSTTSIWTIDLAHLLRSFALNVSFITVTLGANPNFAVETFYQENMAEDCERVNRLFDQAPEAGIQIQWRSVCGDELCTLILSGRHLAIALVDKHRLNHQWLDGPCSAESCDANATYTGHYVVICGYDMETDEFEIRDPAVSNRSRRISVAALDEARKCFGTDEDILLVDLIRANAPCNGGISE